MKAKEIFRTDKDIPVLAAPMAGVTDHSFRTILLENGADCVCTEMVSCKGLLYGNQKTFELIRTDGKMRTAVQLFGHEPSDFFKAIDILQQRYDDILLFDINMGCPAPKIYKEGDGCALLKNPGLAIKIVEAAKSVSSLPVTVKMRIGIDSSPYDYTGFASGLEKAGADAVTVHGRTREQFYSGSSDRNKIREIKEALSIPVIANGDIFSEDDAVSILDETGADGIMIARGMLGDPFIFGRIRDRFEGKVTLLPSPEERTDVIRRQYRMAEKEKGEYTAIRELRKHLVWYVKGIRNAASLRNRALSIENRSELEEFLRELLIRFREA